MEAVQLNNNDFLFKVNNLLLLFSILCPSRLCLVFMFRISKLYPKRPPCIMMQRFHIWLFQLSRGRIKELIPWDRHESNAPKRHLARTTAEALLLIPVARKKLVQDEFCLYPSELHVSYFLCIYDKMIHVFLKNTYYWSNCERSFQTFLQSLSTQTSAHHTFSFLIQSLYLMSSFVISICLNVVYVTQTFVSFTRYFCKRPCDKAFPHIYDMNKNYTHMLLFS